MSEPVFVERQIGDKTLRIETGKLAKQATGAVLTRMGDTIVLSAMCVGDSRGQDFFPLTLITASHSIPQVNSQVAFANAKGTNQR